MSNILAEFSFKDIVYSPIPPGLEGNRIRQEEDG